MFHLFLKHNVWVCVYIFLMCLFTVHSTVCCIICYCCLLLIKNLTEIYTKMLLYLTTVSSCSYTIHLARISPSLSMCLQSPLVIPISSSLSLHPLAFPNMSGLSRKHAASIIFPKAPAQFLSMVFAPWYIFQLVPIMVFLLGISLLKPCVFVTHWSY